MNVSGVTLTREEGAIFFRPGNLVLTLAGISSSDVGCVEDDLEWGVFRGCKAEAGVVKGDPFEGSESESESRITLDLRWVRVRVLTWGEERQKISADRLQGDEWVSAEESEPPKTSTLLISAGAIAVRSGGICVDAPGSSSAFEMKERLASKSSPSSSSLSCFFHANSNFDGGCGLASSSVSFIEFSQSKEWSGELWGTSSERPGGAVLCILSRDAELGARDEFGASSSLDPLSSRCRPYVLAGR